MINTNEINGAVQSFQNTVEALKSIEMISAKASEQLDSIQSSAASIKTATEEIVGKADSLASQSDSLKLCVNEAKESNTQNTAAVTNKMQDMTSEVTGSLKNETEVIEQLRESVRNYTLSTQSSVDELRISQNRSATEIREAIAETKKTVKVEIEKVSQNVFELSEKVTALKDKQQKEHTMILVGVILAAIASIASIIGLFI